MHKSNKRKKLLLLFPVLMLFIFVIGYFLSDKAQRSIVVQNIIKPISEETQIYNVLAPRAGSTDIFPESLTGGQCADGLDQEGKLKRPIGVMLAADGSTRPLSGIGQADVVIEMPVIAGGINRFLAIFQCSNAQDIGSIRSARDDFIPLATGFDAIYAHWGGSHFALDELKKKIIDNIDALKNPFGAFYRKKGIRSPDNGFTSIERLNNAANKLGYRLIQNNGYGYKRIEIDLVDYPETKYKLEIKYPGKNAVNWIFDPTRKTFLRFRAGTAEIDKNTNKQVEASNVIILKTTSRQIEGQYNDVRVTGGGEAVIYRAGQEIYATWEKEGQSLSSRLRFIDTDGQEILLATGKIWLEYIDGNTISSYLPIQ